ncbi:MAG: serine/threonine protein kinase, partial [Deltaproteobacteria bacterium]|nr:serine/threonine protein kinase [Deltaproteobacteria bacterium]
MGSEHVDETGSTFDIKGKHDDIDLSSPAVPVDSLEQMLARAVEAPAEFPQLAPGTLVGERYAIERVLGAGGMGTVYVATDRSLDRRVALKLHRTSSASDRLHREAIAMARLSHKNVVTVYEVGAFEGRTFVAMEYIAGTNLRTWLAAVPHTWREVVAVLCEAGAGLAAAHGAGLVHRDVKPDNIFIGEDGRVCIGDFGLALLPHSEPDGVQRPVTGAVVKSTMTGAMMGTPMYMAPEQILGEPLDARTDQFAFAVAAWEAVCGERPYEGKTIDELHAAIEAGEPRPPKRRVPARIRRVLARGMASDAAARWPSVSAMIRALRSAERHPRILASVAGGTVLVAAAAAWFLWPGQELEAACTDAGDEIDAIVPASIV